MIQFKEYQKWVEMNNLEYSIKTLDYFISQNSVNYKNRLALNQEYWKRIIFTNKEPKL